MKKNTLLISMIIIVMFCLLGCDEHSHTFSDAWTFDELSHWHAATCGHDLTADKTDHIFNEEIIKEATKEDEGIKILTCEICGYTRRETIPTIDHVHSMSHVDAKNATCTTDGNVEYYHCSECNKNFKDENGEEEIYDVIISKLDHNLQLKELSIDENKLEAYLILKCNNCNEEQSFTLSYSKKVLKEATCTQNGQIRYTVNYNNENYFLDIDVPALTHVSGSVVTENIIKPTCTSDGSHDEVIYCTRCNEELSREHITDDALGHNPRSTVIENEIKPTCTNDGSHDEVIYCTRCNEELSREHVTDEALGHISGSIVIENKIDATCTSDGGYDKIIYCTRCNIELSREHVTVAAFGHNHGPIEFENEIDPTCTNDGGYDKVIYCTICYQEISREHITETALGHDLGDWIVTLEPTFTEFGEKKRYCSRCDYFEEDTIDPKIATISFDLDGGASYSHEIETIDVHQLNKNDFAFDMHKDNYRFKGWVYNGILVFDNEGNLVNDVLLQEEMTFKALFKEVSTLTISYTLMAPYTNAFEIGLVDYKWQLPTELGTGPVSADYELGEQVNLSLALKDCCEFVGWYSFDGCLSTSSTYRFIMGESELTISARIKYKFYNLDISSYNTELGQIAITNLQAYINNFNGDKYYTESVKIAALTLTDARFLGWFDENDNLVSSEVIYNFNMPNYDYKLIAKWDSFNINYHLDDGINNELNPSTFSKEDEINLYAPTKDGYEFVGWYLEDTYENWIDKIEKGSMKNYDLYAKWLLSYPIIYHLDEGINHPMNDDHYIYNQTFELMEPYKAGYSFMGWYLEDIFENEIKYIETCTSGPIEVFAKYECHIKYQINYDNRLVVLGYNPDSLANDIVVLPSYEGVTVTKIDYGFENCTNLTSVELPATLESIKEGIFAGCTSLERITVLFIGEKKYTSSSDNQYPLGYFFGKALGPSSTTTSQYVYNAGGYNETQEYYYIPSSLKYVRILDGCEYLQYGAFYNCIHLETVILPNSMTHVSKKAFYNCSNLLNVSLPDNITTIEEQTFRFCSNLKSIILPSNIISIGDCAFYDCQSLENFELPLGLMVIGVNAFTNCSKLISIEIHKNVESIGSSAFSGCSSLEEMILPFVGGSRSENTYLGYIFGGIIYDNSVAVKQHVRESNQDFNFYMPKNLKTIRVSGCEIIDYYAFENCITLEYVEISYAVKEIKGYAFYCCSNLKTVKFDDDSKLEKIDDYAFYKCYYLSNINLPSSLEIIGDYAFYSCGFVQIVISSGVKSLGKSSFESISRLENVFFSSESQLKIIDEKAFYYCQYLTSINIPASVETIGNSAFHNCFGLAEINFESGSQLKTIKKEAFYRCDGLTQVILPSNLESIEEYAIYSENINKVFIPASVTSIKNYALRLNDKGRIYCEVQSKPDGWENYWNSGYRVLWGYTDII